MGGVGAHSTLMTTDFRLKLNQQIGFLVSSCSAFDSGHHEEALRIAVSLRVLFHDTNSSVSLLTHLGVKDTLLVLSTLEPGYIEDKKTAMIGISIPIWIDSSGERTPPLGQATRHDFIPAMKWWSEIVMGLNHPFSRKDIVLGAANQDGGAHVDSAPDPKTEELIEGIGTFMTIATGVVTKRVLDNQHFPLLRQFAFEVLNSPELRKL